MLNEFQSYDETIVRTLFTNFTDELEEIQLSDPESVNHPRACMEISRKYLNDLRELVRSGGFTSDHQEISFFKNWKPLFSAQLIYYAEIYHLTLRKPQGSKKQLEDFYMDEYDRINLFFGLHSDFYRYYRSQETQHDEQYFLRKNTNEIYTHYNIDLDHDFSTGYDLLIARFKANEMFSDYLGRCMSLLQEEPTIPGKPSNLTWTAPITSLAELVISLDAYAAFNNAPLGIGKLSNLLTDLFNLKPINVHKKYEEIRIRKKNRTVFLDALKLSLLRKMDLDDENAL